MPKMPKINPWIGQTVMIVAVFVALFGWQKADIARLETGLAELRADIAGLRDRMAGLEAGQRENRKRLTRLEAGRRNCETGWPESKPDSRDCAPTSPKSITAWSASKPGKP